MSVARFLSFLGRFFSSSRFSNKPDLDLLFCLLPMLVLAVLARYDVMAMGEARENSRSDERALLWPVVIPNHAQLGAYACFPTMVVGLAWPSSIYILLTLQGEQISELLVCKSMEISVELQVTLNLHMRKGDSLKVVSGPRFSAFLVSIVHGARRSSEVAADNEREMWEAKVEALEANLSNMMISNRWYAELILHHALILEITDFSFQPVAFAAHYWKCLKWNNMISVDMRRQVNITAEALLDNFVHAQHIRFKGSKRFGCAYVLTGSSFGGFTSVSKEQVSTTCFCCSRSSSMDVFTVEDTVPLLFGLCHRRWTTAPSLLTPRFNRGDSLSLSSVKAIRYLQLNAHKPRVHTPERPLGESPAGYQPVWSTKEALDALHQLKMGR